MNTADLKTFLEPDINRETFITSWLAARNISHTVVPLSGKRHIYVKFRSECYDPRFRMKTLIAHYDRAANTPGANDNSAACFQLMLFAEKLRKRELETVRPHNVKILFSDGEEAAGISGIKGQGSYAIGRGLKSLKKDDEDIFVFDACGRGDTLILSTAGNPDGRLTEIAREASPERWLALPTPYSDNAGLLAAGIRSQVITVLPSQEATLLLSALMQGGKKARALTELITLNGKPKRDNEIENAVPRTWRLMHTGEDSAETLTASAFALMDAFLDALARRLEPV